MEINIKRASKKDAIEAWELVKETSLDTNSAYFYLVMFSFFQECSAVARNEKGEFLGFICGFSPEPDVYFCWQVGVSEKARKKGLAKKLLNFVTKDKFSKVHASVTPSNTASKALFQSYAEAKDLDVSEELLYGKELFGKSKHAEEVLLKLQ